MRFFELLSAALLFFTPMAILMSSARNSRTLLDGLAFALGLVVGPVVAAQKIGLAEGITGKAVGDLHHLFLVNDHAERFLERANRL